MTLSEFLEAIDRGLPRGYRVRAEVHGAGHAVVIEKSTGERSTLCTVERAELVSDARAAWLATSVVRAVREL